MKGTFPDSDCIRKDKMLNGPKCILFYVYFPVTQRRNI